MLARSAEDVTVREVIAASELETFELHCATHPVEEARCSAAQSCSIRPVWMMLQRRIDDVLESVCLADLMQDEMVVRARVGLGPAAPGQLADARGDRRGRRSTDVATPRRLPIFQD